ncbi:secretin and TonB N-terminal domain-containing protein [Verrucomicrobiales bacterium BCK34]|nr:secretin and TonB N-terminal domain-containing protein [Verrucomicrobiales bacterium BCK34]
MKPIILCLILVISAPFASADDGDLYTNTYVVPPTFLNADAGRKLNDPYAALKPGQPRKTAKEILTSAGITFGVGASAVYNPATSQLIVRNTQDQMSLVEAYVESIAQKVEKQIYLVIREVQVDSDFEHKVEGPEGIVLQLPPLIMTKNPARAFAFDSYDSFRREFSKPPVKPGSRKKSRGRSVVGALTDPQFQILLSELKQRNDIKLLNTPSVMCRSGQVCMSQTDDRRYGVNTVLGANENTVDLKVFLPAHGEALFDRWDSKVATPYALTIGDGHTAVFAERRGKGGNRFVFVTAQIMDPAGMPIRGKADKEKDEGKGTTFVPHSDSESELVLSVRKADEAALRGSQLMADGDYAEAVKKYAEALKILPEEEITEPRRRAYQAQFDRAKALVKPIFADSLKRIIIPEVEFREVPLEDALGQVLVLVHKHADRGLFPDFNPRVSLVDADKIQNPKITLRLSNVPASEALRYITALAQCHYEIEGDVIVVEPLRK